MYTYIATNTKWRSQDIVVARAQHGQFQYALPRKVQKFVGGSGGILLQPPRSVLRPYTVVKSVSHLRQIRVIHSDTSPFDFKSVQRPIRD